MRGVYDMLFANHNRKIFQLHCLYAIKPLSMDKYHYYRQSVQCPEDEVAFFLSTYREIRGSEPRALGEDFSGAFAVACEWVRGAGDRRAVAVDLSEEALLYGKQNEWKDLEPSARERIQVIQANVLDSGLPRADIVAALNFSYFTFKTRELLGGYFKNVHSRLESQGLIILDCFGGSAQQLPNEEETEFETHSFFWDQVKYDPISNRGLFHIHFQVKGQPKQEKLFTYDWRMWTIPEIRELLGEAGFKTSYVYWEGADENGDGNNIFTRTEEGDDSESWLAYIVGVK